ncbi:hypothetical protein EBT31_00790 [bacterium]|nr:hypothetical protein [bacterium]
MAIETATNPKTGERAALVDGKWLPIEDTATNAEGKKAYRIGGKWMLDEPPPAAPEPAPAVSEVPAPRARPPWAQEYPNLYSAAQTTRQVLGPTIEASGAIGGAVVGAPFGPPGLVGGSALGYGTASGLLRQADIALGNVPEMTPLEGISAGTRDLLMGAIYESGGQVTAPIVNKLLQMGGAGVGKLFDALSGQIGQQKAAKILKETLKLDDVALANAIKEARGASGEVTAAQSIAGLNSPTTQALLAAAAERKPSFVLSTAEAQEAARLNKLAELAGGSSQAASRTSQKEAKNELRKQLIPQLEIEMTAANTAGKLKSELQAQAERMGTVAGQKVEDVRRMTAASDRLSTAGSQKGAAERGLPVPGRYTYEGELAKRADEVATQAAEGSLVFGEASRFATAAANSLEAHGLKPLKIEKVTAYIDKLLADPRLAPGSRDLVRLLTMTKNDLIKWTNAGGVIDAWAIDTIRKNLNANARRIAGTDPTAQKELAAKVNQSVGPILVDAIEAAGGTGYRAYLEAYSQGLKAVGEKKLSAKALQMYQTNPQEFIKLVEGNNLKEVEKAFGAGSYDIVKEMSAKAMQTLKGVAGEIKRDIQVGKQVDAGQEALRELLKLELKGPRAPGLLSAGATITNTMLAALEKKLGKTVMDKLTRASQSGQDLARLLDTMPAVERNVILRALNNPQEWAVIPKEGRGAAVNVLAPENRNKLRK